MAAGCLPKARAALRGVRPVVSMVTTGVLAGVCPAHGLTTLYYLVRKNASKPDAAAAMDRVLRHFQIGILEATGWQQARCLRFGDFEDAVVATVAKATVSNFIITLAGSSFVPTGLPGSRLRTRR